MYLGRIIAVGMTPSHKVTAMYRVSSRSFPNRQAVKNGNKITVVPRPGFEEYISKNPYISYNCIRFAKDFAVITNGSHTEPIFEKIAMGMPIRDAMALSLLAMDYEKDELNTPRIAAAIQLNSKSAFLGTIKNDALLIKNFSLKPKQSYFIGTYNIDEPSSKNLESNFTATDAQSACDYLLNKGTFANFTHPVAAAAVVANNNSFELATQNL